MAFWCKFFMSNLILGFGSLILSSCSIKCSCMAPHTPGGDSDEGVGFPTAVLYVVDKWIVFGVFVCCGLCGESIVAVSESAELA